MSPASRKALAFIHRCVRADRYVLLAHFRRRMTDRGLIWPDILAIVDAPTSVHRQGDDDFGREKWLVRGFAADGLDIEMVCAFDVGDDGDLTVFITLYTH
jgi:uncharacterized protein DUF4258